MLDKAITLVSKAFEGRKDKGGKYYILHCLHVMFQMDGDDEELMTIAVLHDLIEDTDYTIDNLRAMGFSERVLKGVDDLTHRKGEPYMDYIRRTAGNPDSREAKKEDLKHNSNIMRMKGLRQKDFLRLEKYFTAYEYLKD